jgi:hypothetical protein
VSPKFGIEEVPRLLLCGVDGSSGGGDDMIAAASVVVPSDDTTDFNDNMFPLFGLAITN